LDGASDGPMGKLGECLNGRWLYTEAADAAKLIMLMPVRSRGIEIAIMIN
jgi:hypothetical protein